MRSEGRSNSKSLDEGETSRDVLIEVRRREDARGKEDGSYRETERTDTD